MYPLSQEELKEGVSLGRSVLQPEAFANDCQHGSFVRVPTSSNNVSVSALATAKCQNGVGGQVEPRGAGLRTCLRGLWGARTGAWSGAASGLFVRGVNVGVRVRVAAVAPGQHVLEQAVASLLLLADVLRE